ncbi:hypothetical protein SDJN02_03520, partial [Cucurbita argyrosperma subsp. argyrosperma]
MKKTSNMNIQLFGKTSKANWEINRHNQYLEKNRLQHPPIIARTLVSVEEIRSAPNVSDYYPPSLHGALVSSPEPDPRGTHIYENSYMGLSIVVVTDKLGYILLMPNFPFIAGCKPLSNLP